MIDSAALISGELGMRNGGYVQVEGINIYAAVFDTTQLSVIRGGSFLLAEAVSELPQQDSFNGKLQHLSIGASSGLYAINPPHRAADVAGEVAKWLRGHPSYRHFTFAVAHLEPDRADIDLTTIKAALSATIRRQQLQQLSSAPDIISPNSGHIPCGLTGIRACREDGDRFKLQDDQPVTVSDSVAVRLRKGRDLKASMYLSILRSGEAAKTLTDCPGPNDDQLEELKQLEFVRDLETLGRSNSFRALNNKIAVIYLDGNGFGSIQRRTVNNSEDQRAFDRRIRECRAHFLLQLLLALHDGKWNSHPLPDGWLEDSKADASDSRTEHPGKCLRLETLLWGGDEMTLVVPAWLGFDVLQMFYAISARWQYENEPLTHAGGIVFCHAHSPIGKMRQLATRLADDVKEWMRENGHRTGNWFDYLVLESIDYPTEPTLDAFHNHRYGDIAAERTPIAPDPAWLDAAGSDCRRLLDDGDFSRGQVFSLARAISGASVPKPSTTDLFPPGPVPDRGRPPWSNGEPSPDRRTEDQPPPTAMERWEQRLVAMASESDERAVDRLERLAGFLGLSNEELGRQTRRAWLWLHLAELWDYLVPTRDLEREPTGTGNPRQEGRS